MWILIATFSLFNRQCLSRKPHEDAGTFCIVKNSCRDSRNEFHSWESWWTKVEKSKVEDCHPSSGICRWLFGDRWGPHTLRFPSPSRRSWSTLRSVRLYMKRVGREQIPLLIISCFTRTLHLRRIYDTCRTFNI